LAYKKLENTSLSLKKIEPEQLNNTYPREQNNTELTLPQDVVRKMGWRLNRIFLEVEREEEQKGELPIAGEKGELPSLEEREEEEKEELTIGGEKGELPSLEEKGELPRVEEREEEEKGNLPLVEERGEQKKEEFSREEE